MISATNLALVQAGEAAADLRAALQRRDQAVWDARDAGASLAQIAISVGLTRSGVQGVIGRRPTPHGEIDGRPLGNVAANGPNPSPATSKDVLS